MTGNARFHLLGQGDDLGLALCRVVPVQPVKGEVAADFCEIGKKVNRFRGRNGVPRLEVGVIDTLLGVLPAPYDILRQPCELRAIPVVRLPDGVLVSGEEQLYDLFIIHSTHLLCFVLHPDRRISNSKPNTFRENSQEIFEYEKTAWPKPRRPVCGVFILPAAFPAPQDAGSGTAPP